MPTIPVRLDYPRLSRAQVTADEMESLFKAIDDWTSIVGTYLNTSPRVDAEGLNISVPNAAGSVVVTLTIAEPDTNYAVVIETNWGTTHFITAKLKTGFTANFGTAAPASATMSWMIIR
jgi:hypothetical protein